MQCIYCKKQVPSDALTCPFCGKSLVLDPTLFPKAEEPTKAPVAEERAQEVASTIVKEESSAETLENDSDKEEASAPVVTTTKQDKVKETKSRDKKPYQKRGLQLGKIIMIMILTTLSISGFILLKVVTPDAAAELIDKIKADTTLRVINYILIFIPTLLIFILGQLGFGLIIIIAGITILVSLLVMIKATKTKKFLLLGIIALNVALIISAIIMYWH